MAVSSETTGVVLPTVTSYLISAGFSVVPKLAIIVSQITITRVYSYTVSLQSFACAFFRQVAKPCPCLLTIQIAVQLCCVLVIVTIANYVVITSVIINLYYQLLSDLS